MGLDNGICVKRNEYSNSIKKLKGFTQDWDKDKKYDFEFCYWRKCWNVRSDIFNIITPETNNNSKTVLTIEDIVKIIKLLKSYNKKTWDCDSWNGSIWTWSEHKAMTHIHIKNLYKLIKLMKRFPKLEVYFYDSY